MWFQGLDNLDESCSCFVMGLCPPSSHFFPHWVLSTSWPMTVVFLMLKVRPNSFQACENLLRTSEPTAWHQLIDLLLWLALTFVLAGNIAKLNSLPVSVCECQKEFCEEDPKQRDCSDTFRSVSTCKAADALFQLVQCWFCISLLQLAEEQCLVQFLWLCSLCHIF